MGPHLVFCCLVFFGALNPERMHKKVDPLLQTKKLKQIFGNVSS